MKVLAMFLISFSSVQAYASIDCTFKAIENGKSPETKVDFKKEVENPSDRDSVNYRAEMGGYELQVSTDKSTPPRIQLMVIIDKATKRRSVSGHHGMKPDADDAFFMSALIVNEGDNGESNKAGKLICRSKR